MTPQSDIRPRRALSRAQAVLIRFTDRVHASDPGLDQLRAGLQMMLNITVSVVVMYAFMQVTHVLWVQPLAGRPLTEGASLALAAQHHGVTLLAMLLGGIIAAVAAIGVSEPNARQEALTMTFMPIPLLGAIALAVTLVPHHTLGIVVLAVMLGVSVYTRKFVPRIGPRAVLYGLLLFVGYIFGFLANGALAEHQLGWLAVVTCLAVLVNLLLKVAVYGPLQRYRLTWSLRSFRAQADQLITTAVTVLDQDAAANRVSVQLHQRMRRLNATALVIDASLTVPRVIPAVASPGAVHRQLFATERTLQNVVATAERLADAGHPADRGLVDAHTAAVAEARRMLYAWPQVTEHALHADSDAEPYRSQVMLLAGSLPGSALVGGRAAAPGADPRGQLLSRLGLDAPAQLAIRVSLAAGTAAALGSVLSERRYYWAVIAVFVTYMGANTSGEQVTRAAWRIIGTFVGIVVGGLLASAVGHSTWSLPIIIVAFGTGAMLMKTNYAFFVVGLTVAISQLYAQLGEYSNHLLVLRLEENAIGAVIAALAALWIFPVSTRRAARLAAAGYLTALSELLDRLSTPMEAQPDAQSISAAVRGLDAAHHQLHVTARPIARYPWVRLGLGLFTTASHQARALVDSVGTADPFTRTQSLQDALDTARQRTEAVATSFVTSHGTGPASVVGHTGVNVLPRAPADSADHRDDAILDTLDALNQTVAQMAHQRSLAQ